MFLVDSDGGFARWKKNKGDAKCDSHETIRF